MSPINIKGTKSSPEIVFDSKNDTLSISGDSYPENSFVFFKPLTDFINEEGRQDKPLTVNITLNYFNSSTSKVLFDIFDELETGRSNGKSVVVNWIFEEGNDFIQEEGNEYALDYPELINVLPK